MEVKKIVEGMTAPQVAQVIKDNFNEVDKDKANKTDLNKSISDLTSVVEANKTDLTEKIDNNKVEADAKLSELGSEVGYLESIIDGKDLCNIIGEDINQNTGEFIKVTSEYKIYFSRSELIPLYWFDNYKQLGLQVKSKSGDFLVCYYDSDKNFIAKGGISGIDIPSNAFYVAFRIYIKTSTGNVRTPLTFYNFGLYDVRNILRKTTLGGITDNPNTNELIKELYLEGLDVNIKYGIYNIKRTITYCDIYLYKFGENYTNGGYVAKGMVSISDVNNGIRIIKLEELNNSGINGYAVINFDLLSQEEQFNCFSVIREDRVKSLDLNPTIKNYLSKIELDEKIDDLMTAYDFTDGLALSVKTKDSYSRYENGALVVAGVSTQADRYTIIINDETLIRCYCGLLDDVAAVIAFYSTETPKQESYIKEFSIQGEQTNGKWFDANIPNGAKSLTITNIRSIVANPIIKLGKIQQINDLKNNIHEVEVNINTSAYIIETIPSTWIKAEDGSMVASYNNNTTVKYSVKGLSKVKVTGIWYDALAAAIAFFAEDGTYLSEYTVNGVYTSVAKSLESDVPTEAAYALSCSGGYLVPIVETEQIGQVVKELVNNKDEIAKIQSQTNKLNSATINSIVYPTNSSMDYHHLFIDKIYTDSEVTIPCQSVFDVYVAAKLGFDMIEVNVLETSDGVAVTGHHVGTGNLQTLTNLEGVPTEVHIPSITFEELRTNYRYKSIYPQYKTPITSLEEFLLECKRYNITPFVQCVSDSVVELTESIMGKRYVAYDGSRKQTDVTICEYKGGTINEIVDRCKLIGAPYIFAVSATTLDSFTNEEIKELTSRVHAEGCWVGWAGSYHNIEENLKYRNLGLDFCGSGWDVPDFEIGDEAFIYGNSIKGFGDFDGSYTVNEGVANLVDGQSMYNDLEQKSIIAKGSLHIQFKGELGITFGKINSKISSDGLKEIVLTSIIENINPKLYLYSSGNVEIYNVSYKVSSVI